MPPATSIASDSRVHSSTTVRHLSVCPFAQVEHEVVRPDVIDRSGGHRAGPAQGDPAPRPPPRHLQPRLAPEAMGPVRAHRVPFAFQENPNPAIAVPRILRRTTHRGQRRGIPVDQPRLVAQRGPCDGEQGARAATRQTACTCIRDLRPAHACAYHFFRVISLSTSISRSRSATKPAVLLLELPQPLHIGGLQRAEVFPPGVERLGADAVLFGHLRNGPLIGLAEDRHHLLFGKPGLLHRGRHSLRLQLVRKSPGRSPRWSFRHVLRRRVRCFLMCHSPAP